MMNNSGSSSKDSKKKDKRERPDIETQLVFNKDEEQEEKRE
jgi:hypothetical protein